MRQPRPQPISGHVSQRKGKRGGVWYAKYRLPDGRQVQKRIGWAWTEKTAPPEGYFTKASAKAYLDQLLAQARQGTLPGWCRRDGPSVLPTAVRRPVEMSADCRASKRRWHGGEQRPGELSTRPQRRPLRACEGAVDTAVGEQSAMPVGPRQTAEHPVLGLSGSLPVACAPTPEASRSTHLKRPVALAT